jgi:hypothetical protein
MIEFIIRLNMGINKQSGLLIDSFMDNKDVAMMKIVRLDGANLLNNG